MAEHAHDDHHDDHASHQAPWVMHLTVIVCVGITFALLFLKSLAI